MTEKMNSLRPYLKRIALDTGVLPGSQDYVKFIILSRSRTGSEYLRSLLNSHSQVTVFGELFQQKDNFNWNYPGYYRSRKQRAVLETDPMMFLKKEIFRKYPKDKKAIGFKIFYYHAQKDAWKSVWTYLQSQKDLKVIHLKRKNILETHLSRQRANRSGKWINLTGEKEDVQPVALNYEECLHDFVTTRQWEAQYKTFFEDHDMIDVFYENLSGNTHAEDDHITNVIQALQPVAHALEARPKPTSS